MTTELIFRGKVAGVTFSPAKENLQKLVEFCEDNVEEPIEVTLRANPANLYDKYALEVWVRPEGATNGAVFLGHVPRSFNEKALAVGLDKLETRLEQFNRHDGRVAGVTIEIIKRGSYDRSVG